MFSVIFDMDGTLFDTQKICVYAWDEVGLDYGIENLGDHIPAVCGMNKAGYSGYLKNKFPQLDVESFLLEVRKYIQKNLIVKYKKGAEELIDFLKKNNIKMGIASGSSRESIVHHINEVGATELLEYIAAGPDVKNGKPAPDVFLLCAKRMGVDPKDCFVFEDSVNGIKAGVVAGMKCIGIPDVAEFDEDTKKLMFAHLNDFTEAIPIFEKLL